MKRLPPTPISYLFLLIFSIPISINACNLSSFSLVSTNVVGAGPTAVYTITTNLCIGYGITGAVAGADAATQGFVITIYGAAGLPTALTSFTSNYQGPALPGVTYTGTKIAAGALGLGEADIIYYASGTTNITCRTTTAACGNAGTNCQTLVFTYTGMYPDSIRVMGIEGAGNPLAGCYPDADMKISLVGILPVAWGAVSATPQNDGIEIQWNTQKELNAYKYYVKKFNQEKGYVYSIGQVKANGESNTPLAYSFFDNSPDYGDNFYQIEQVDINGTKSYSSVLSANFVPSASIIMGNLMPNPVEKESKFFVFSTEETPYKLYVLNLQGQIISIKEGFLKATANEIEIDVSNLYSGIYILRLVANGSFEKKIVKI